MKKGKQTQTIIKILKYIRRYWGFLGISILLSAVTVVCSLYLPLLTGDALDLIIKKGVVDFTGILEILQKMGIMVVFTALAQWIMNVCNNKITYNVIRDVRKEAFQKLENLRNLFSGVLGRAVLVTGNSIRNKKSFKIRIESRREISAFCGKSGIERLGAEMLGFKPGKIFGD